MDLIPMIGKKYNHLTVIDRDGSGKSGATWICKCDCGKLKTLSGVDIRRGHWKSCGCRQAEGSGPERLSSRRVLTLHYASYRSSKRAKELGFELTFEEFENICRLNCFYCTTSPQLRRVKYRSTKNGALYTFDNLSGVDRFNNKVGYTLENSIPCCGKCNLMKGNSDYSEFMAYINRIYHNLLK